MSAFVYFMLSYYYIWTQPLWVIVLGKTDIKFVEETVVKTVEETILKLIQQKSSITTKELANETKLSRRGVEYQLNNLISEGKIQRSGSTIGGH